MPSTSLYNCAELTVGDLTITVHYMGVTNYALAHNRIPVVYCVDLHLSADATDATPPGEITFTGNVSDEHLFTSPIVTIPALLPGTSGFLEPAEATRVPAVKTLESTEARSAEMTISARVDGDGSSTTVDLEVLAPNEWFNSPLYFESLAAFVQPNSPTVSPVLHAVSDLLLEHTGNASISGNQGGPERTVAIAAAVYGALRAQDIRYINPPASFEFTGQRVRPSGDVLSSRRGTCIDLSLAYAAVAEQCGLRPVVLMLPGHAMAGVLMSDTPLPSPVITEPTVINNYIRSGEVLPIDATFYDRTASSTFSQVVERSRSMLEDVPIYGVVDIRGSHRDGMRPFPDGVAGSPAVTVSTEEVVAEDTVAGTWSLPDTAPQNIEDATFRDADDPSPVRVQKWKRELLDLSLRNRLLNMRPGPEVLDFRLAPGSLADIDDMIHDGSRIAVHPSDDVSDNRRLQGIRSITELPPEQVAEDLTQRNRVYADLTEARYTNWFHKLNRQVRTYSEETGSSNLYLTLGAMLHQNTAGKPALAPLFLIPVKVVGGRGKARFQIQVDTTQEATPNHCLVEWLHRVHNVHIDALARPKLDDSGLDIDHALSAISAALIETGLPFTVVENSRLIVAKFSTYGMWKDLRDNWETFLEAPVFRHLATKAGSDFDDPVVGQTGVNARQVAVREEELALPIAADGAQLHAVTAAAAGYSFVLEGPPGTGKSQTITNLIAHCMSQGKKVLFVAEKQAALDVVRDRLDRVGLAPFTLDLHGAEQKPQAIRQQLKRSVDTEVHYDMHLWDAAVANLRSRLAPLAEYSGQIHDRNGANHSLWSAVSSLTDADVGPTAPVPEHVVASPSIPLDQITSLTSTMAARADVTDFDTTERWSLVGAQLDTERAVMSAWQTLTEGQRVLEDLPELQALLAEPNSAAVIDQLREVEAIPDDQRLTPEECRAFAHSRDQLDALAAEVNLLVPEFEAARTLFSPSFLFSGDSEPILRAITDMKSGFFGKRKRREAYQQSLAVAVPPGTEAIDVEGTYAPEAVETQLLKLPQLQDTAAKIDARITQIPGARQFCGRSPADPTLASDLRMRGLRIAQGIEESTRHPHLLDLARRARAAGFDVPLSEVLGEILEAWTTWTHALGATEASANTWVATLGSRDWVEAWLSVAAAWAEDLQSTGVLRPTRTAQWEDAARPLRAAGLGGFVAAVETGTLAPRDLDMALYRGIAEASVSERSQRFNLASFHRTLREDELTQLTRAIAKVQKEATRALPARLLSQRPFTPGQLDGRAALLRRQLDAKRNAKSFRNLLSEYGEEILSIAPCFFVSPASLATFVAPDAVTFDIVIFDEASQVTVDQAMGALGRARSAIIVGDSKQMPPTRIGKTAGGDDADRPDDEDEGEQDAMADIDDLESILSEAVESGLPQLWLSWHYRSRDESLIAFSNGRYYEGNLSSLPSPGGVPGAGVSVQRVDGQFIRKADVRATGETLGTNPVEARAIVDSVIRRVNDPLTSGESIGVVTFNVPQRDHVLDLLEACGDPLVARRMVPGPDGIFVKNLENVQGDERDVILFSTAFSKRSDGGSMPMNFGPLSRKGGERRLNVAVTRARKEVQLFCSFSPSEIDLNRTSSEGLRDLRGYLEAADRNSATLPGGAGGSAGNGAQNTNVLRDEIASELRARGWVVETDFGLSSYTLDLVARPADDERWHAAILTDGDKWNSMSTVADRDLTPDLLGSLMHWAATVRVWLPEWIADRDAVVDRVEDEIHAAGSRIAEQDAERERLIAEAEQALADERERIAAEERAESEARERALAELEDGSAGGDADAADVTEVEDIVDDMLGRTSESADVDVEPLHWTDEDALDSAPEPEPVHAVITEAAPVVGDMPTEVPYVPLETDVALGEREELEAGFSAERSTQLTEEIGSMIALSAPVRLDHLRSAVAKRFGRQKTSRKLNQTIDELIPQELVHAEGNILNEFVWPSAGGPEVWNHVRRSQGRNIGDIPLKEISGAVRLVLEQSPDLAPDLEDMGPESREALHRAVLKIFSISRLTRPAAERIDQAVQSV